MPETTTEILAAIFGLYFVVGGLRLIFDAGSMRQLMWDFHSNGALTFIAGLVTFAIGATVVAIHREWSDWVLSLIHI